MQRLRTRLGAAVAVLLALGVAAFADDVPKIRSVTPNSAPRGTQVDVVFEGSNLAEVDDVLCSRQYVGVMKQKGATDHRLVVRLTIPDDAEAGPVKLTLKSKSGDAVTERFSIKLRAPILSKMKPDVFRRGGEYDVSVAGTNLEIATAAAKVVVDAPMTVKNLPASTDKGLVLKLTVPGTTPPGAHVMTVETPDGKVSATFTVVLSPPSVSRAEPAAAPRGAKAELKIRGANLAGATAVVLAVPDPDVTVAMKGAPAQDAVAVDVTLKPTARPGPRTLVLLTPDGAASASFDVVTRPPSGLALSPAGAVRGSTVTVAATGQDVPPGSDLRVVPDDPSVVVATQKDGKVKVEVAPGAAPGARTFAATTADGVAVATFAVTLRVPAVTSVTPVEVPGGAETEVAIEGSNLDGVAWSLAPEDPSVSVAAGASPDRVRVTVKAGAKPGPRTLVARTAEGASTALLTVAGAAPAAPILQGVSPLRVARPGTPEVVLRGLNLRAGGTEPPAVEVRGPGGSRIEAEIASATPSEVRVRLKAEASTVPGAYVVTLTTVEGGVAAEVGVEGRAPAIAAASPASVARGADVEVTLTGTGLSNPDGTPPSVAIAEAGGGGTLACRVVSATAEKVTLAVTGLAVAVPGPRLLALRTSDGGAAVPFTVEAAPPSIAALSLATIGVPATEEVAVTGKYLLKPDGSKPAVQVTRVGSASALTATLVSATADAAVVRVTTPPNAPAGPHLLVLRTADGEAAALFAVVAAPPPRITKIDITAGARGGALVTVIRGTGFLGATGVAVSGEGVTVTILPGATDTELQVRFAVDAAATLGPRTVSVTAPGGKATTQAGAFTVK